ncbi:hypothetical protein NPIL_679911 [Nephila pilipes]|uniref:Uncharacterized protein n=1 Tax=Nephila pilipes TaxID=299642 RepID=A0A8X6U9V6_NEPPI|nr:hypothetical protein NPIL_679911 [Nephila pilipes]
MTPYGRGFEGRDDDSTELRTPRAVIPDNQHASRTRHRKPPRGPPTPRTPAPGAKWPGTPAPRPARTSLPDLPPPVQDTTAAPGTLARRLSLHSSGRSNYGPPFQSLPVRRRFSAPPACPGDSFFFLNSLVSLRLGSEASFNETITSSRPRRTRPGRRKRGTVHYDTGPARHRTTPCPRMRSPTPRLSGVQYLVNSFQPLKTPNPHPIIEYRPPQASST